MYQIGAQQPRVNKTIHSEINTTIQPNQYGISDESINTIVDCSVEPKFGTFTSRPRNKGNISALQLAIVTNKVVL